MPQVEQVGKIYTPNKIDEVPVMGRGGKMADKLFVIVVGVLLVLLLVLVTIKLAQWLLSLLDQPGNLPYSKCTAGSTFTELSAFETTTATQEAWNDAIKGATAPGAWRNLCLNQYYEQFQRGPNGRSPKDMKDSDL